METLLLDDACVGRILVSHWHGGNQFLSLGGDKLNQLHDDRKQNERAIPIINLQAATFIEFQVDGENKSFAFYRYHSSDLESFVYELRYPENSDPSPVTVIISVVDFRGIKVRGRVDNLNLEETNA